MLYLRGREVARDLAPVLVAEGYEVDPIVVYASEATPQFRPPVEQKLRQASIEAAILFSPGVRPTLLVSFGRRASITPAPA